METTTIIYLVIALLISIGLSGFQYYYKIKSKKKHFFLFLLRFLSLFFIGVLFVNPKIKSTITEDIKPKISVLVDNSSSIKYFRSAKYTQSIVAKIRNNSSLNDKFTIDFFSFGEKIKIMDTLNFNQVNTNIFKALETSDDINKKNISTTILISDGNQTIGNDYTFHKTKKQIFPIVIGDTIKYEDIKIAQLNVNKYSYLKNKFPVEIIINYDGKKEVKSQLVISKSGKKVFSQLIPLSSKNNTTTVLANLESDKEGIQFYKVSIQKLKNEKNVNNNYKNFSVEVINEQTKVLVLASIIHPDLGMLKKSIEQNKQRKVEVSLIQNFKGKITDYQLVIFYQPNNRFKNYFNEIKSNFILISGAKTDWNFVNSLKLGFNKKHINQNENYAAIYNPNFMSFLQKDIDFSNLPPLSDRFGELSFSSEKQDIIFQKVSGVETKQPLISTFDSNDKKFAVIFGEGLWKWRAMNYREKQNFEDMDNFISNLVQYVSSTKKRKRLEMDLKRAYPSNQNIVINTRYLDKNYRFDSRASLKMTITNLKTKQQKVVPFSLANNSYRLSLNGLESGNYAYKLTVDSQDITKSGRFIITEYKIEEQFVSANVSKLNKLALNNASTIYFKGQEDKLIESLINNDKLFTTQKSSVKEQNLIHWKWILFIVLGLLAIEWFLRKYYGKI